MNIQECIDCNACEDINRDDAPRRHSVRVWGLLMNYTNAETHAVSGPFGVDTLHLLRFPDKMAHIVDWEGEVFVYDNWHDAKSDFYEITGYSA